MFPYMNRQNLPEKKNKKEIIINIWLTLKTFSIHLEPNEVLN